MGLIHAFYDQTFKGLLACVLIAIAAVFLSTHYGAPVMLFALLLGISLNFLSDHEKCQAGVDFAAKKILRLGVALLGLRISSDAVIDLGWPIVLLVVVGVVATMGLGFVLTRTMKTNCAFGCLTGGSVAICGASAAMALSSVLPDSPEKERDTIFTVITVTALSTIAMILYPVIASFIGLDARQTGIFLGATIHDVAQVVGAGYGVSDQTGDISTIVKLLRVAMLLPVVLIVMVIVKKTFRKTREEAPGKLPFPWFVIGFICLVGVNSADILPQNVSTFFVDGSRWCIITAVAALGMKTSFKELAKVGYLPVMVICAETVFLAILALSAILMFNL